ncbi:MAG TPA: GxxExxY protein [Usitatibacter sp.]|nr:GxxExxY protein [Usitatibacter sp.]
MYAVMGQYIPDLLVDECILVEIKAVAALDRAHRQQCIHYLKATGHRVCLLINFGRPRLEFRRFVWRF